MISNIPSRRSFTTAATFAAVSFLFAFNAGNALGGGALGGVGGAVGGALGGVGGAVGGALGGVGGALGGGGGAAPGGAGGSAPGGADAASTASTGGTAVGAQAQQGMIIRKIIRKKRLKRLVILEDGERCDNTRFDFGRSRDCYDRRPVPDEAYGDDIDQASASPVDEPLVRKPKKTKKAGLVQRPAKKKATAPKSIARLNIEKPEVEKPKLTVDPKLTKPKAVEKAEPPVKKKTTAPKSTTRLNVEKPRVDKPKPTVDPKLIKPNAVERAEPESELILSCDKAGAIVGGYGFIAVNPSDCDGRVYAFNASRDGRSFTVTLNAVSGELIEVRKVP